MAKKRTPTPMIEEESSIICDSPQPPQQWPWCRCIACLVVIVSILFQSMFMDAVTKSYQDTVPPL
eukprot:scaffold664373_cov83-Attheya_sp.AAC.1